MHLLESIRRYWLLYISFFVLAALLVACGSATGVASSSNSSRSSNGSSQGASNSSTSSSTSSAAISDYGTANGCPSNAVATAAPGKASIIVKVAQINQTILAHNGDSIEIQLPFGHRWTGPGTSQGILQIQGPAGYASKNASACIWRFMAKGTGAAQLIFHSQALCQAGQVCPMYITSIPFDFNVK